MMLSFSHVTFAYAGREPVVSELTFGVEPGAGLWLRGPNGSGKSTILRLAAAELTPQRGVVNRPQGVRLLPDTVRFDDYLRLGEQLRLFAALTGADPADLLNGPWFDGPDRPDQRDLMSDLSLGWRKRVALAILFTNAAPLYLLDEPLNGLDDAAAGLLATNLERCLERGASVVCSSHVRFKIAGADMDELDLGR